MGEPDGAALNAASKTDPGQGVPFPIGDALLSEGRTAGVGNSDAASARCWPWQHRWLPYKAIPCAYSEAWPVRRDGVGTLVSERCDRCGKRRQDIRDGIWTLEELVA